MLQLHGHISECLHPSTSLGRLDEQFERKESIKKAIEIITKEAKRSRSNRKAKLAIETK